MRFGVSASYEDAKIVKDSGYDYLELYLSQIATMEDSVFEEYLELLKKLDIKAEVFNRFLYGDLYFIGPKADRKFLDEYIDKALLRASKLGGKMVVLGGGKRRVIDENDDFEKRRDEYIALVKKTGETAKLYDMSVVIEPLCKKETNFITKLSEGAEIAAATGLSNVVTMVDFYHFCEENEPLFEIEKYKDKIGHIHIASATKGRVAPHPDDVETFKIWSKALKDIDYDGLLSIEAEHENFQEEIREARKLIDVFK